MDAARSILEKAESLFDAVGISSLPGGETLLVLGLESKPERDLDEFGHTDAGFRLYGFEKYAAPRLEALTKFIRGAGFSAELTGRP